MKPTLLDHLVLQKKFTQKSYAANNIICDENCLQSKLFLIVEGVVKITHLTQKGDEIIPIILTKNMIFGAETIFDQSYSTFSSESLVSTLVYIFGKEDVYNAIQKNPEFHYDLLRMLNDQYCEAENRIKVLKLRSAEQRFMHAIMEFKNKFGHECHESGKIVIKLPFDQESLGRYIRVSRETVCLILNNLKSNAILDYKQHSIIISAQNLQKIQQKSFFFKNSMIENTVSKHI